MTGLVDAHQHYWDVSQTFPLEPNTWFLGAVGYPWRQAGIAALDRSFLPAELEPELAQHGVRQTVLLNALHSAGETAWMLELADTTASIAGVVGWLDLARPQALVEEDLQLLRRRQSFVGVRHLTQFDPDPHWLTRPDVIAGLSLLERDNVPFDLLVTPGQLPLVNRLSERVPSLRMVIDHAAKPEIAKRSIVDWEADLRRAAENPSLHCKLSGLVTEAGSAWELEQLLPYAEVVFDAFGVDRVMYGSDWPVCTLAASYGEVLGAATDCLEALLGGVTDNVAARVFAENARAFYGLPMPVVDPA